MTQDHQIEIVRRKKVTMKIEILNAYNAYFMSIPFQEAQDISDYST